MRIRINNNSTRISPERGRTAYGAQLCTAPAGLRVATKPKQPPRPSRVTAAATRKRRSPINVPTPFWCGRTHVTTSQPGTDQLRLTQQRHPALLGAAVSEYRFRDCDKLRVRAVGLVEEAKGETILLHDGAARMQANRGAGVSPGKSARTRSFCSIRCDLDFCIEGNAAQDCLNRWFRTTSAAQITRWVCCSRIELGDWRPVEFEAWPRTTNTTIKTKVIGPTRFGLGRSANGSTVIVGSRSIPPEATTPYLIHTAGEPAYLNSLKRIGVPFFDFVAAFYVTMLLLKTPCRMCAPWLFSRSIRVRSLTNLASGIGSIVSRATIVLIWSGALKWSESTSALWGESSSAKHAIHYTLAKRVLRKKFGLPCRNSARAIKKSLGCDSVRNWLLKRSARFLEYLAIPRLCDFIERRIGPRMLSTELRIGTTYEETLPKSLARVISHLRHNRPNASQQYRQATVHSVHQIGLECAGLPPGDIGRKMLRRAVGAPLAQFSPQSGALWVITNRPRKHCKSYRCHEGASIQSGWGGVKS
ncbi:hypothetical protein RAS2_28640 [Phycisphaerae bacterium RAS2]|nr:hypothetical protein RAS2_28640 [Phycisphaerae bacterium RAS2]